MARDSPTVRSTAVPGGFDEAVTAALQWRGESLDITISPAGGRMIGSFSGRLLGSHGLHADAPAESDDVVLDFGEDETHASVVLHRGDFQVAAVVDEGAGAASLTFQFGSSEVELLRSPDRS